MKIGGRPIAKKLPRLGPLGPRTQVHVDWSLSDRIALASRRDADDVLCRGLHVVSELCTLAGHHEQFVVTELIDLIRFVLV